LELNRRLIAGLDHSRNGAIDGLRHPVDFDSLSEAFGASFRLIFLEARQEVRSERMRSRFSADTAFQVAESAPVEAHIDGLKLLASTTIPNEGSLESLYRGLDAWVATCEMGDRE
jgi:dephospho-CoA kinase